METLTCRTSNNSCMDRGSRRLDRDCLGRRVDGWRAKDYNLCLSMPSDGTVLIAGAGIGGLALGCALQQAGIGFEIFERAPSLGVAGAGIVMQTSAMLALRHL